MSAPDAAASAQAFYTRWARAYDLLARHAPGARGLRERAVRAFDPDPGATVLELGCGTGANFPHLREAVGPGGRVVGVDFAPGPLAIARDRARRWRNVHVVRGDATRPPVAAAGVDPATAEAPDAVLASFVIGMLADPGSVVAAWAEQVGPGGRLALLDLARSTRPAGRVLNPAFGVLTRLSAPSGGHGHGRSAVRVLDERVAAAHRALFETCRRCHRSTHLLGFARLSAGTVAE